MNTLLTFVKINMHKNNIYSDNRTNYVTKCAFIAVCLDFNLQWPKNIIKLTVQEHVCRNVFTLIPWKILDVNLCTISYCHE